MSYSCNFQSNLSLFPDSMSIQYDNYIVYGKGSGNTPSDAYKNAVINSRNLYEKDLIKYIKSQNYPNLQIESGIQSIIIYLEVSPVVTLDTLYKPNFSFYNAIKDTVIVRNLDNSTSQYTATATYNSTSLFDSYYYAFDCCDLDKNMNIASLYLNSCITSTIQSNIQEIKGTLVDISNIITIISQFISANTYGANSNINYSSPTYDGITTIVNNIPVIEWIGINDYILFEFKIPSEEWLNQNNLLSLTPYFFSTDDTVIFGSTDTTIFIDKNNINSNNIAKICFTTCENVANKFISLGYIISKIPIEYIENSTFSILIRIGLVDSSSIITNINSYMKSSYFINNTDSTYNTYFTSKQIIESFPPVYPPLSNPSTIKVVNNFNNIETYLDTIFTNKNIVYPYLSNIVDPPTNFAIQNFYDSINLPNLTPPRDPINIQANNTGENYFLSNGISTVDDTKSLYLYILYLNQNSAGSGITSNIQIYDTLTHNEIFDGTIYTAPNLPPFTYFDYPYPSSVSKTEFSDYGLYSYPISYFNKVTTGNSIYVCERI